MMADGLSKILEGAPFQKFASCCQDNRWSLIIIIEEDYYEAVEAEILLLLFALPVS